MKSVEKSTASISDLHTSMAEAISAGEINRVEPPLEHYHTDDLYGRRIFVPGGTVVITKVHKKEHITIALRGHCTVIDGKGHRTEVIAPMVFVTKPGTRRAVYAHNDVEWLTVHACEIQGLENIEASLVCDSFEEADQDDYRRVLKEHGITEEQARQLSENPRDQMLMPTSEGKTCIQPSQRQGMGVFATEDIEDGARIGPARIGALRTPIGRYTNHSINPNCMFIAGAEGVDAYAIEPIQKGTEITVCYRQARAAGIEATRLMENQL